ncbi:MAG TPA: hypothetical protein ENI48_09250, partial [Thioploca sp.]|nr:hypothetical protein [Thioploca sp.]
MKKKDNQTRKPATHKVVGFFYIVTIATLLAVLAVVGFLGGKWLRQDILLEVTKDFQEQNKKFSELRTQLSRSETALQTLKEVTAGSVNRHSDRLEQLNSQFSQLNSGLLSLKEETAASDKQQNAQLEQQASQATQLKTALTANMTALAEKQNDKFKGLETQLSALKTDTAAVDKQQNAQL